MAGMAQRDGARIQRHSRAEPPRGGGGAEVSDKTLPPWPEPPGKIKRRDTTMYHVAKYHQALAAAWEARARLAVEALSCLYPGLALDLRYETDPDAIDAFRSRVNT